MVLFRTGGDFLTSLSWALGRASIEEPSQILACLEPEFVDTVTHKENVLSEAEDIINSLIHAEIDQLHGDLSMVSPSQININQIIQDTNFLRKFLVSATRTVQERHSSAMSCDSGTTTHKKKIRHFYIILCQLQ